MKINSPNVNFSGKLYLKNPDAWTDSMKQSIANNESIQNALKNNDVIGDIFTKVERSNPPHWANHFFGDTLYKVSFTVQKEGLTKKEALKEVLSGAVKKYIVNRHFHSEFTTVNRIKNLSFNK